MVNYFRDGLGAEHTVNYTIPVHGDLFENRFGPDFFEYNNRSVELDQSELEKDIIRIYRNEPVLTGPLKSEPIDLSQLVKNLTVVGSDGEIRVGSE